MEWIFKGVNKIDGYIIMIFFYYINDCLNNLDYFNWIYDEFDIVWVIVYGKIVEGYDLGEKGRNFEFEWIVMGLVIFGDWIVIIVLMKIDKCFIVKIVYLVNNNLRYMKYILEF